MGFGIDINKDVVRRILAAHYQPPADRSGPSWLTFLGHAKDSLQSILTDVGSEISILPDSFVKAVKYEGP